MPTPPSVSAGPVQRGWNPTALAIAVGVAILGFAPIVNWINGGHEYPEYQQVIDGWLSGGIIVVGVATVLAIASRRIPVLWCDGLVDPILALVTRRPWLTGALVAGLALALYAVVAVLVFDRQPLLIDEIVQVFQARIFAEGRLARPAAPNPEFFGSMHVVDHAGLVYGQFPAGGPGMLLLGELLGATWLIGPLFGAVSVLAFHAYLRTAEPRAGVVLGATLLFACAPFVAFMAGSYMNHVTALTWLLIAMAALARVVTASTPRPGMAVLLGLGFGIAATIRPADALAFALPAGVWLLVRALRDRARWADALPAAIGVALPIAVLFWVNLNTTGHPLRFGYIELWGKSHELGFHEVPWGPPHTPVRGVELVNLYFLQLQTYLFETPLPSLVPAILALGLTRRFDALDRYLLVSAAVLVGLYFAYWHNGFYLGPRFMYPLAPVLVLWTARLPAVIRERLGVGMPYRAAHFGYGTAAVMAVLLLVPIRGRQYANGLLTMRWNADSAAAVSGVHDALVLVRESWGAQLIARMWGRGVPRTKAEQLYRRVDACRLEIALTELERTGTHGAAALAALWPLTADSSLTVKSPFSPDDTERYQAGVAYADVCWRRIADDRRGSTLYPPLLLADDGGNVYARDLHARDTLLLARYPGRPIYLLKPPSAELGDMPRFYPVSRDSLRRAWRGTSPSS